MRNDRFTDAIMLVAGVLVAIGLAMFAWGMEVLFE